MREATYNPNQNTNKANAYLLKEISEASPQKLIIKLYDLAIVCYQKGDFAKANKAVTELINSLNFVDEKAKEISFGLLRLYQFAQEQARKGNLEVSIKILQELRDTWTLVFTRQTISY
ncbi:MAG: flagellar export chaperone FliS [bacterium]